MTYPIPLPDWLPGWVPIALLVPALLYLLVFLFMPFSVLGLKSRLEVAGSAAGRGIQGEIRSLSLRLPELAARSHFDELYAAPPPHLPPPRVEPPLTRPPIPPAPRYAEDHPPGPDNQSLSARRPLDPRAGEARRPV